MLKSAKIRSLTKNLRNYNNKASVESLHDTGLSEMK